MPDFRTAAAAVVALSLPAALSSAHALFNGNPDSTTTALAPEMDQKPQWKDISKAFEAQNDKWRFLPPKTDAQLKKFLDSLEIEGVTRTGSSLMYVRGGVLCAEISFSLNGGQPLGLGSDQTTLIRERADLMLKKELPLFEKFLKAEGSYALSDGGGFIIRLAFTRTPEALPLPPVEALSLDLGTKEGRAEAWVVAAGLLQLGECAKIPDLSSEGLALFTHLREKHIALGEPFLGSLAQAMCCIRAQSADAFRAYVDMGRISPEEMDQVPPALQNYVRTVNYITRNFPSRSSLEALEARVNHITPPSGLRQLIELEESAGIISKGSARIAQLEIQRAAYFARTEAAKLEKVTSDYAIQIVRRFFDEDFANDYRFRDSIQGLGSGLALRRTDCSTRALVAREMLRLMGFEAGAEILLAQKDGVDAPNIPGHMYNFLKHSDGFKTYVDFCVSPDQAFVFLNNEPIIRHYLGDSQYTARVLLSSSDSSAVYSAVIREPVNEAIFEFVQLFEAAGKALPEFLDLHPEAKDLVKRLRSYSDAQDKHFGSSESEPWEDGSQGAIRRLYGDYFLWSTK